MELKFDVPEEIAEKIAEDIKAALEEYKKKQTWPQEGDDYYFIFSDGQITCNRYDDFPTDRNKLKIGNMFKTEEEAMFKREQLKVLHELEQLADDDQEWNCQNRHHIISYDHDLDRLVIDRWTSNQLCQYYFKSQESAQIAIDKIGVDRLKKYYFRVKEDK